MTGKTKADHLAALDEVENAGLHLKRKKCSLKQPSVTYLGHLIDAKGLHPLPVRAVHKAPRPTSVAELKSYLGLLTYYSKFLPCISYLLCTGCCAVPHAGVGHPRSKKHLRLLSSSLPLLLSWSTSTQTWRSLCHVMPHRMASGLCFLTGCQMVLGSQLGMPLAPSPRLNRSTARLGRRV